MGEFNNVVSPWEAPLIKCIVLKIYIYHIHLFSNLLIVWRVGGTGACPSTYWASIKNVLIITSS